MKHENRTELEQLLSVFDQSYRSADWHILNIKEEDYPEKCREVIRRLGRAIMDPQMRDKMDMEDEILEELEELEREIEEKDQVIEEKNQALEEKDQALEEKDRILKEKNKIIEEFRKRLSMDQE